MKISFKLPAIYELNEIADYFESELGLKLRAKSKDDTVHGYLTQAVDFDNETTRVDLILYEDTKQPTKKRPTTLKKRELKPDEIEKVGNTFKKLEKKQHKQIKSLTKKQINKKYKQNKIKKIKKEIKNA